MQIELNGKRNITLDFNAPKKFKLYKDGAEVPYIRTGKNSFRLGRNVDGVVELEEIIEKPKIVKPMQLQPQQMALVNPNDVIAINQAAQQLEIEQGLLSETQKQIGLNQEYLDVQQQRINEAVLEVKNLETNNAERITAAENGIFNLAGEIASVENNANDGINSVFEDIEAHKRADNPHNITKKTIGLDKVDNTSDMDKPVSKAVQEALDEKADKTEIAAIREEIGEYQEKSEKISNALSTYTGGLASMSDHRELEGRDFPDQHPIGSITGLQNALDSKVNKTAEASKVYGTDADGNQTLYDSDSFGKVDDIKVNGESIVDDKVANLGTMALENASDYSTKDVADTLYAAISYEGTIDNHIANKNNPHEVTKAQVGLGNVDNTSDLNKPISTATQTALDGKVNTTDLGNAELDIQKNGTSVGKFTANASVDKVINLVIPTQASDINALSDSTKYGAGLSLSINSSTYVVTAQLKDQDGNNLGSAQTIDLPLESVVVNGSYDSTNKKIILTLENGNTIDIPVGDLVAGLQSEITVDNKLSADLVDDSNSTNKFVTASDISTWNAKQNALTAGTGIDITSDTISNSGVRSVSTGATNGTISVNTNGTSAEVAVYGLGSAAYTASTAYDVSGAASTAETNAKNYADSLASNYATAAQGAKADTALQPNDNITQLNNNAGYITGITSSDVTTALGYTPYNSSNPSGYTSNVGTVTSVNNTQPDANGNVTISTGNYTAGTGIDITSNVISVTSPTLTNQGTGINALAIGGRIYNASATASNAVAILGHATADDAIQLGSGVNLEANSFYVGTGGTNNYKLLGNDGLIPDARISSNIARTTDIPTIPTVNNATLTIQKNSTDVATFTANASSNVTANISVPTDTGDLTNNAGFITGITSGDVTTALGYTPVNPTSLATVATSGSYNDLSNKPTVDQTYDGTSANAQSGVAVASAISGKANDSDVVKLTGNQTIAGEKTFSNNITINRNNNALVDYLAFRNGVKKGGFRNIAENGNTTLMYVTNEAGNSIKGSINLIYNEQTNVTSTTCPNPTADTTSSTQIDTVGARNRKLQSFASNCITEIPQDIKLELNNGTLTLKAGSKVYVPNGTGVFDVVTIASDMAMFNSSVTYTDTVLLCTNGSSLQGARFSGTNTIGSGTLADRPAASSMSLGAGFYYATDENKLYYGNRGANTWTAGESLPIAIVKVTSGVGCSEITQVFNGFGYIGSTVFALPGVKGLIPNGRNADGTLKNTEFTISSVLTTTDVSGVTGGLEYYLSGNGIFRQNFGIYEYKPDINYVWDNNANVTRSVMLLDPSAYRDSGKVTSLTPKTAFHALDWNDSSTISGWAMPSSRYINLTIGASGASYTAPANGYIALRKRVSNSGQAIEIRNNSSMLSSRVFGTASNQLLGLFLPVKKGDEFVVNYDGTNTSNQILRFIYAEGDQ